MTTAITRLLFETPAARNPEWRTFRQQGIALLVLNIVVLAAVVALPIMLSGDPTPLKTVVLLVVTLRALEQFAELAWLLLRDERPSDWFMRAAVHLSIWINVAFAYFAALLSLSEATHFVVLMVIPLIAASFRVSVLELAAVLVSAIALTFLEVFLTFNAFNPTLFPEYFHASTVALMFLIVATMVRLLASNLKRSEARLRESLVELERTKDRLVAEENLAAVGRLASAIAHEIRNPVAMITSSAAMVKDGGDPSRTEILNIVQHEAARLERLTTDFLSYARPKPPERKLTPVRDSVNYVASLAAGRASEAGVRIEPVAPDGLMANVDAFQLHQVLLNLVMNAIDATPRGKAVQIGARAGSGDVTVFWVENSGEAIPAEAVRSRIFQPFYTTKKGGTGLGLAIARNIVRGHRGMLVLARNQPGCVRFEAAIPNHPVGGDDATHSGS
jgi:signal transduction histidine kinase